MFTDEQMELFKKLAEAFRKLINKVAKGIVEIFNKATMYFDEINKLPFEEPIHPASKKILIKNHYLTSQILLRKPRTARARSSC